MPPLIKKVVIVIVIAAVALAGCLPGASVNEYSLKESVDYGKFPSSEVDRIAYALRKEVESNYRWNMEWLTYWGGAEMTGFCGTIKVNDLQEGKSSSPIDPIMMEDVVSVEAWIEYNSYPESQLYDNSPDVPVFKTVKGELVYRNDSWEVKSAKEMEKSLGAYCP